MPESPPASLPETRNYGDLVALPCESRQGRLLSARPAACPGVRGVRGTGRARMPIRAVSMCGLTRP